MKHLMARFGAFLLALVLLLGVSAAQADQLADIQARGKLIVATEGNWMPWTYVDETGTLTGFDVELSRLIAGKLGVEADFQTAEWSALLAGMDGGRFDIVCNGVDYTPERAEKYDFSDPYVFTEIALVVRKDNEDIHTFEDLAGKTAVNSPGSTYAQRAEKAGAKMIYAEAFGETVMNIVQGRADATINALGTVEEYFAEQPDANVKIVLVQPGDPVCIPLRKTPESATLLEAINQILAEARADGTLSELSVRFFGKDLTEAQE